MRKANYDKWPATRLAGWIVTGWESIAYTLKQTASGHSMLVIDLYPGVYEEEVLHAFTQAFPGKVNDVRGWMKPAVPVAEFLEKLTRAGATHHSALVYDASPEALSHFGELLGLDVVRI